ncbi:MULTISPECIES: SDR family oxidoreductase [unclassified Leifsonia]|uniref:SDR family oxidoreductase n=1 Tax=unclassified Leifsonia TaxID=2663824 RepID=UPI0008A790EF|nr:MULTISPECIES: SDR family oxidoreductase [unclassified Leifsonia]SEI09030.1 NAD(P)H-binding [Leifsonia sp. CL154]SFL84051.1 NAD(P)H-binding [Leifsonia sp. CL147]
MTRVAIIGAHGKVAQQLMRVLYDRGDDFVGVVRNDEHADDVYRLGGEGALVDLESAEANTLAAAIAGCDAVVFAAGAGPGSGAERKRTVDFAGSTKSQEAAAQAGIRRFVQISAWGVDAPVDDTDPVWKAYVEAKRDADAALRASTLDWTILRPGGLTTEEGTGSVTLGDTVPRGTIAREDVARLIAAALDEPRTIGRQWEVVGGETPIEEAVRALVASA